MRKPIMPGRDTQVRFFRFLCVGGLSAGVQLCTVKLFSLGLSADLAFSLSFGCGTFTHYCLNRFWALPSSYREPFRQALEYLATAALSYGVNLGLFKVFHDLLGLSLLFSTALAIPPSTLLVFLCLNYHVFRKIGPAKPEDTQP